ncbi:hypothetical protein OF381_10415 [Mannheimia haemolytica]
MGLVIVELDRFLSKESLENINNAVIDEVVRSRLNLPVRLRGFLKYEVEIDIKIKPKFDFGKQ